VKPLVLFSLSLCVASSVAAQEKMLSQVNVRGQSSDIEVRRSAATQKIVIDRQAIEATGGLYIGEVLSKLPGIDAGVPSSDGTVALRSRGMVRDSVQVLIDGERPPGDARHALLIVARMPAGELERVEVMKGASAEFGSATPVTVNLITTKAKRKDSLDFKVAAGVRDQEPVTQVSVTKGGSQGAWSWTVPLSISRSRSPIEKTVSRRDRNAGTPSLAQDDTTLGRNQLTELFFGPKLSWREKGSSFSIWPMLFYGAGKLDDQLTRGQYTDPQNLTGLNSVLTRNDHEDSSRRASRLRLEGDSQLAGGKVSGRLTLVNSQRNSNIRRDSNGVLATEASQRSENEINSALRMDRPWGDHVSAAGLEYIRLNRTEDEQLGGTSNTFNSYHALERQSVIWLQDEWALANSVTLTSGVRGEAIHLDADGVKKSEGMLAPSIAVRWEAQEGWLVRGSLGSGIKAPKLEEISNAPVRSISSNSPLEPDRRGNLNLTPEKSVTLDLALEHFWPDEIAVVGANVYLRQTENFIERRTTQEGSRWVERPYNEGDAKHWGFELDGKVKMDTLGLKGGAVRSHLTLPHAQVNDQRLGITRNAREVPDYILTFGYDQTLPSLSSNAGLLLQQTGTTRTDVSGEQWAETKARSVLDAYWVRRLDRSVNLRISLQNILGSDNRRTVRAYSAGQEWQLGSMELVPRTLLVTIEGKW
jgi:iron complex outermembrane receptor protein